MKYSGIEVQQISADIGAERKDIRVLDRASEQELKKLPLNNYKIIHLAAHAIIDDQKPARSAIILSTKGDAGEDGFVQMREIYNLRLNADLVILSACQTGRGQYIRGEGIESLNRAFFYAGASAVLTSLWSINDQATAQLMARFYFHLRRGYSLMEALRTAKVEMNSLNHLPSAIKSWLDKIDFIAVIRSIFCIPQISCYRIEINSKTISYPICIIFIQRIIRTKYAISYGLPSWVTLSIPPLPSGSTPV